MATFQLTLTIEADYSGYDIQRAEVSLDDEADKDIAIHTIQALNILTDDETTADEPAIDNNTMAALALGHLGVGQ